MLEINNLVTYYGAIRALNDVSLQVNEGEIVALIGANGAGKSTLLNTVSGLIKPRQGRVLFRNADITRRPPELIVRTGLSLVPERRQVFSTLPVRDNLMLGAYARLDGARQEVRQDIARMYEIFPILEKRQRQMAGTLSGGEQQMLAIARGLMSCPKLLMLDEPSVGLAPLIVREILRVVTELRTQGTTILIVEQNALAALSIADRGYVLENGEIVLSGPAGELLDDSQVQRAYLGKRSRTN